MGTRPFRWAIFGSGAVARKFAHGLTPLRDRAVLATVASRRPERAATFAESFPGSRAATSYEDALTGGIDAVYIATPPALHEVHAIMALEAGCAALVEKPFATDAAAATRIAEAARRAGCFCMEAMWTRFLPLTVAIRDRIESGALGTVTGFDGSFQVANKPDPAASLFEPTTGGGSLLHRGVYPVSLARFFLGPVAELRAVARIGSTGVDEDCVLTLRHASDAISTIRCSLVTTAPSGASLFGTAGTLSFSPIWRPESASLHRTRARATGGWGGPRRFEGLRETAAGQRLSARLLEPLKGLRARPERLRAPFLGNGYTHEALAVIEGLEQGLTEAPLMPLDESIEILGLIDAARAQFSQRG